MVVFGLILVCLLGVVLTGLIGTTFSWLERIGLSFPLGMALQTILIALLDLVHIPLTATSVLLTGSITCAALIFALYRLRGWEVFRLSPTALDDLKQFNWVWIALILFIGYCEYLNFTKCLFYPPHDRDSLAAFETLGYVAAQEHTYMRMSLFDADYNPSIHQAGSSIAYAPFVQMSYLYVYLLGAETSKVIPAMMYLFFIIAFYAITRRHTGKTTAALATMFAMLTPEMLGFSSLSGTNVMQMVFAGLGIIYTATWLRTRQNADLWMGAALLGANMWCRNEGIVFIGAACIVLLIDCICRKSYRQGLWFTGLSLLPAAVWFIYMKIGGLYTEGMAITHLFWDGEKAAQIAKGFWDLFTHQLFYGWTFKAFLLFVVLDLWFIIKRRDNLPLLGMILLGILLYALIIYHVDYVWDSMQNVLNYSTKRFFFCFVPMCWYFVATGQVTQWCSHHIERFLALKKD